MNQESTSLSQLAFKKFKRNKLGFSSFIFIILCGFLAIFCYVLSPDKSSNANQMHLEIHSKPPGFSTLMLAIPSNQKETQSWFNFLLFGKKNQSIEIPIIDYKIEDNNLVVTKYTDGLEKKSSLSQFKKKPTQFIKQK